MKDERLLWESEPGAGSLESEILKLKIVKYQRNK